MPPRRKMSPNDAPPPAPPATGCKSQIGGGPADTHTHVVVPSVTVAPTVGDVGKSIATVPPYAIFVRMRDEFAMIVVDVAVSDPKYS